MYKRWATKHGFTIIELMVTIVIIGILALITIVSYSGVQQRSRDSTRSSNITELKIAIEKYHADESKYPDVCSGGDNVECAASDLSTEIAPYLKVVPHDPKNVANSATDYRYIKGPSTTDSYGILVTYEAKPACKTGQNVDPTWWSSAIPSC